MQRTAVWIMILLGAGLLHAGQLRGTAKQCFQEVVVTHHGTIRAFVREGGKTYGDWYERTPFPRATQQYCLGREWTLSQSDVRAAMGSAIYDSFARHRQVKTSGHFNVSGDPDYDWRAFGGDSYGSWSVRHGRR